MPMQRWMHSAAGGTSQRLNPALAMMRSRSRRPIPPTGAGQAWPMTDIIHSSQCSVAKEERAEGELMNQGRYSYSLIVYAYIGEYRTWLCRIVNQNSSSV